MLDSSNLCSRCGKCSALAVTDSKGMELVQRGSKAGGVTGLSICSRAEKKLTELDALQTNKNRFSHLATCEMTSSALWDRLGVTAVRACILEVTLARGNCQKKAE